MKLARRKLKTQSSKRSLIYYFSLLLLFVYSVLCLWELMGLLHDKKRFIQIPLALLVFFISTILPYLVVRYSSSFKKAALVNIIFASRMIVLFWLVLLLAFFGLRALSYCSGFACWFMLIPIIWFVPNFILSVAAILTLGKKLKK